MWRHRARRGNGRRLYPVSVGYFDGGMVGGPAGSGLLLEQGNYLLLESASFLLLE